MSVRATFPTRGSLTLTRAAVAGDLKAALKRDDLTPDDAAAYIDALQALGCDDPRSLRLIDQARAVIEFARP